MEDFAVGNRRDIMFLQAQNIPWELHTARGQGALRRRLSQNTESGAESFALKLAPNYVGDPGFLRADFEFFILQGNIEINGVTYQPHCYGMHPAGYTHSSFTSRGGAVVLVITAGGPDGIDRGAPRLAYRRERLALIKDTTRIPWVNGVDPVLLAPHDRPRDAALSERREAEPGVFTKLVWEDPDTKGHTFLRSDLPRISKARQTARTHSVDAEYFIFDGDYIIADEGRMTGGAYFFWRANVMHGPSACEFLSHMLGKYYGPATVVSSNREVPVTLDPVHNPQLPDDLRAFGLAVSVPDPWS